MVTNASRAVHHLSTYATLSLQEVREIYFSKPSWDMKTSYVPEKQQVPLRFKVYFDTGELRHATFNMYNFISTPRLPAGAFDIRQCFTPKQRKVVHFSLIGL